MVDLPKQDIEGFLYTIHRVVQQHMVYRQEKSQPLPAFCLQPYFFFADLCCAATFQMVSRELTVSGNPGCMFPCSSHRAVALLMGGFSKQKYTQRGKK